MHFFCISMFLMGIFSHNSLNYSLKIFSVGEQFFEGQNRRSDARGAQNITSWAWHTGH